MYISYKRLENNDINKMNMVFNFIRTSTFTEIEATFGELNISTKEQNRGYLAILAVSISKYHKIQTETT